MKNFLHGSIATIVTTIFFTINSVTPAQASFNFDEVKIDQNQVIAMAMGLSDLKGASAYKLMILEQHSNEISCWNETETETETELYPILVKPLLVNFNYSGICQQATDSNDYSIRVDGNDLSLSHRLILENIDDEIKLFGISIMGDKKLIGRTRGLSDGIMKIFLEPGWQFTKRSDWEKVPGHFYFSYDSFAAKQAAIEQKIFDIDAQIPDSLDDIDEYPDSSKKDQDIILMKR
ncbi:MAG: DUF3747 domain-containing protein [Microcoleaceae cyanobacterium]